MARVEWQKQMEELGDHIKTLEKQIQANFKEMERLTERQEKAEERVKNFSESMETTRKSRQKALVLSENINELNERIRKLNDEKEILGDEIQGISDRLDVLRQKNSEMFVEKERTERKILCLKAIPVRDRYNELAEEMASVVSEIWGFVSVLGEEPGPSPNNRVFSASTWGGALICIPRLYDPSSLTGKTPLDREIEKKDFFKKR